MNKKLWANDGNFMERFLALQSEAPQQEQQQDTQPETEPSKEQVEEQQQFGEQQQVQKCVATPSPSRATSDAATKKAEKSASVSGASGTSNEMPSVPSGSSKPKPQQPVVLKSRSIVSIPKRSTDAGTSSAATKKHKADGDANKSAYLKEMERYRQISCSSDGGDRPLVK